MSSFDKVATSIHNSVHSNVSKGLSLDGVACPITIGKNGMRYLKWQNKIFIQQDPRRKGALAIRANSGERITRIVRSGQRWGYITDKEVVDPLDGA